MAIRGQSRSFGKARTASSTARRAAAPLGEINEQQWQAQVVELAHLLRWDRVYHTHDSRRSESGFPDLVLVRERVIFAELKTERGRLSAEQERWLTALSNAGQEVYVWRPHDLDLIAETLRRRAA